MNARIVAIADSDSYVKWAASLLGSLPASRRPELLIVETRGTVSSAQERAALHGSELAREHVRRVEYSALKAVLSEMDPDAVLISARGPSVRVLARLVASLSPRPVIVTGLPGISVPETTAALVHRTQCDLFILHSHAEVGAFENLAEYRQLPQRFALATLPFLAARSTPQQSGRDATAVRAKDEIHADGQAGVTRTDLVFASQSIVPRDRADRMRIADLLIRAARADPTRRVIVKERALKGEMQTHRQKDALPDLIASRGTPPKNLVVSTVPMARALDTAQGLVTVSSTAVLEALARDIPVITLDTFGVAPELINVVFRGSGMFGSEDDVVARAFRHPTHEWMAGSYFHDESDNNWVSRIDDLVRARAAGVLALKPPRQRRGGRLRDVWERKLMLGRRDSSVQGWIVFAIGLPLRAGVRLVHRAQRRMRGLATGEPT